MHRGGRLISWDMNSSKVSFIRSVFADTIEGALGKAVASHWTFVNSASLARYTGMEIVGKLTDRVDLSLHDSDHTWETVGGEINSLLPFLVEGSVVCVDDANQTYKHTYEPIINMMRRKICLKPISPIAGNQVEPHVTNVPKLLSGRFEQVKDISGEIKATLQSDLYYAWYATDRQRMNDVGMEDFQTHGKRFGAWQLSGVRRS